MEDKNVIFVNKMHTPTPINLLVMAAAFICHHGGITQFPYISKQLLFQYLKQQNIKCFN